MELSREYVERSMETDSDAADIWSRVSIHCALYIDKVYYWCLYLNGTSAVVDLFKPALPTAFNHLQSASD